MVSRFELPGEKRGLRRGELNALIFGDDVSRKSFAGLLGDIDIAR